MAFNSWKDFVRTMNEAPRRSSPAGIRQAIGALVGSGRHTGGNPTGFKTHRKYLDDDEDDRNQISAPPGAPAGGSIGAPGPAALEEEVEEESFEVQPELQPEIWQNADQLWPEVRERLLAIAEDFIDGLEMEIPVQDIRLTGSLANYNWSKYSDVDLHIIVDFAELDEDTELVKAFFDAARARWNDIHAITLYGFEVEIYIEDTQEAHQSSGLYSVESNQWIAQPFPGEIEIDFITARKKSDDIETRINLIGHMLDAGKLGASLKSIEKLKDKIRKMRSAGLNSPEQEYSAENIAFKILRRNQALAQLAQMK